MVDFDFRLADLFKTMEALEKKLDDLIKDDFMRIKDDLGYTPSRLEFFTYVDDDVYLNMKSKSSKNILNDYLTFLKGINDLNIEEEKLIGTEAHKFFIKLETTTMTMSYKMPLLTAFYNEDDIKFRLTREDISSSFHKFYSNKSNGVDLVKNKNGNNYENFGEKEWMTIAKNPMDSFQSSCSEFFFRYGEEYCLSENLKPYVTNDAFKKHFKDIIDYKTKRYYKERVEKK